MSSNIFAGKLKDKVYVGGGAGASFGTITQYSVHPYIGYKLTPKLSIGAKYSYEYFKDNRSTPAFSTYNYGGGTFSRYRIFKPLYAHAEYSMINFENYGTAQRQWVPFCFVGGGIAQPIGKHAWFLMQVLFDVLQDENSPYEKGEPFFSVGFGVGF